MSTISLDDRNEQMARREINSRPDIVPSYFLGDQVAGEARKCIEDRHVFDEPPSMILIQGERSSHILRQRQLSVTPDIGDGAETWLVGDGLFPFSSHSRDALFYVVKVTESCLPFPKDFPSDY